MQVNTATSQWFQCNEHQFKDKGLTDEKQKQKLLINSSP